MHINIRLLVALVCVLVLSTTGLFFWHSARERAIEARELAAAKEALQKEQWADACVHIRTYLSKHPNDRVMLENYAKAQLAVRPQRLENIGTAIAAYRDLLLDKPGDARLCDELARLYYLVGEYSEAAHMSQQRLKADPNDAGARMRLGRALAAQHKYDEVTEALTPLVDAHPDRIEAYVLLSSAALHADATKSTDNAMAWFDRAVEMNPESADARTQRGLFHLVARKNAAQARADFDAADALPTSDPQVLLTLAQAWLELGEFQRARAKLESFKQLEPKPPAGLEIEPEEMLSACFKTEAEISRRSGSGREGAAVADRALQSLTGEWRTQFLPLATELYLADGQIERAEQIMDQYRNEILKRGGKEAETAERLALLNALVANAKEDFHRTINELEPLASGTPRNPQLWRVLAYAYDRTDQPRRAISVLEKHVSRQPGDQAALRSLARLYLAIGDHASASKIAQQGENNAPGDLAMKLLRIEAAIGSTPAPLPKAQEMKLWAELDAISRDEPKSVDVRSVQAKLAAASGRADEAVTILETAIRETNGAPGIVIQLVNLLAKGEQWDRAIATCKSAIDRYPQAASLRITLARLEARAGRIDDARRTLEQAIATLPGKGKAEAANALVGLLLANGEKENAIQLLKSLCNDRPGDIQPRLAILNLEKPSNDTPSPQGLVDEIRKIEGERGLRWRMEQVRLWQRGDQWPDKQEKIRELLGQCIEGDPTWWRPVLALGELCEKVGRDEQAEQVYRRFVDARAGYPGHAAVVSRLLALLERQGRSGEFAELLKRFPDSVDLSNRRRVAIAKNDKFARETIPLLQQAIALNPEGAEAHWGLAMAAHWIGDLDTAEREYRRVLELKPNQEMALNNLAWILCEDRKKPQEALALAEVGVAQYPENPHLRHTLGVIHERSGSVASAKENYEKCLELTADLPSLRAQTLVCLARVQARMGRMVPARIAAEQALGLNRTIRILTDQEQAEAEGLLKAAAP